VNVRHLVVAAVYQDVLAIVARATRCRDRYLLGSLAGPRSIFTRATLAGLDAAALGYELRPQLGGRPRRGEQLDSNGDLAFPEGNRQLIDRPAVLFRPLWPG
jgi:hypothetical protein